MAMNTSQARVVDPVLTNVARGYKNQNMVGNKLFPRIEVLQRGGKVIQFGKDQFYVHDTRRAPGANVAVASSGYSSRNYSLEDHSLAEKVPVELLEDAQAVPGIDLGSRAVMLGMEKMALRLEVQQAAIATNASNYDTANKATLSGTSQWSHGSSTPSADIREAKEAIRAKTGQYPNIAVISALTFAALQENPSIMDKLKYTSKDSLTPDMLAALWGLAEVAIGSAVKADPATGAFTDVWGKTAVLANVSVETLAAMGSPSYGYTYGLKGYPIAQKPWYNPADESWYYPVKEAVSPEQVGADAGFLFSAAVE